MFWAPHFKILFLFSGFKQVPQKLVKMATDAPKHPTSTRRNICRAKAGGPPLAGREWRLAKRPNQHQHPSTPEIMHEPAEFVALSSARTMGYSCGRNPGIPLRWRRRLRPMPECRSGGRRDKPAEFVWQGSRSCRSSGPIGLLGSRAAPQKTTMNSDLLTKKGPGPTFSH